MTDTRRKKENDRKRLRDHELLEVFTHTDTHIKTHAHTNTHTTPPLLCIFIYGCPHYMVPQSQSPRPNGQPLHVLPYCPK